MPVKAKAKSTTTKPDDEKLEGQDDGTDGDGAESEDPAPKAKKAKVRETIAAHGGSASNTVSVLLDRIQEQEARIAELTAAAPAETSTILDAEESAIYQAYKKLGTPSKIAESIARGDSRAVAAERERDRYKASVIHGYDAEVLNMALGDHSLEHGKDEAGNSAAFVVTADPKDETKTVKTVLPEWLKANQAKLLPSLQPGKQASGNPPTVQFGGKETMRKAVNGRQKPVGIF